MSTAKLDIRPFDLDDDMLRQVAVSGRGDLRFYPPPRTMIVLGRGSDPAVELNIDAVLADDVLVTRRPGGGCSVVLDPGNLIVSVALPLPGLGKTKEWFQRCTDWMVSGLEAAGVAGVRWDGISDLVIGDRKIAGSSVHRRKDLFYYTVSLLVAPDLKLMDRYLNHPPREPEYRQGRSHRDFVTTLKAAAGVPDAATLAGRIFFHLSLFRLNAMAETRDRPEHQN